jgi:hypothetical protein
MPLSYQWYSNAANSNVGGTAISGATGASYTVPPTLADGTYYYYCVLASLGAESATSDVAEVTVSAASSAQSTYAVAFPDANFRQAVLALLNADGGGRTGASIITVADKAAMAAETGLDVSCREIESLAGIEHFTGLTSLNCSDNLLTEIDAAGNPALEFLICERNQLAKLDVTNNASLMYLFCNENRLTELDVSNNPKLDFLLCFDNLLTELDVTQNTSLAILRCQENNMESPDSVKGWRDIVALIINDPLDIESGTFWFYNQKTAGGGETPTTLTFAVDSVTAKAGSAVEVPIRISDNPGISAISKLEVTFDGSMLEWDYDPAAYGPNPNTWPFVAGNLPPADGEGIVPLSGRPQAANISSSHVVFDFLDPLKPFDSSVDGILVTLKLRVKSDAPAGADIPITVTVAGAGNVADIMFAYRVVDGKVTVAPSILYGDVDMDGRVDILDVQALLRWVNSGGEIGVIDQAASRITHATGLPDIFDVQALLLWVNNGGDPLVGHNGPTQ